MYDQTQRRPWDPVSESVEQPFHHHPPSGGTEEGPPPYRQTFITPPESNRSVIIEGDTRGSWIVTELEDVDE
jgi:hypothetical protein